MPAGEPAEFIGYLSQTESAARRKTAGVFVLSSFAEGVLQSLMEAMIAGLPTSGPPVAGVPELIEDGVSGYAVFPGDVTSRSCATGSTGFCRTPHHAHGWA